MNATIPDDTITEPKIEQDPVAQRINVDVPNFLSPSAPLRRSYDVASIADDPLSFAKRMFLLGEIHARRCAAEDARREEQSAIQSFDHLDDEAF